MDFKKRTGKKSKISRALDLTKTQKNNNRKKFEIYKERCNGK